MNFDFRQILEEKKKFRAELASRDILEKLRMLDAMRQRSILLRSHQSGSSNSNLIRESSPEYPSKRDESP